MIAGFAPDPTEKKYELAGEQHEMSEEKKAELEAKYQEWQETIGEAPAEGSDFADVMSDVPPFNPGTAEAAIAGVTAGIALDAISPDTSGDESKDVYNANGEASRRPDTVTEGVARTQIENNDINAAHVVQNVASTETVLQDSAVAANNAAIAKTAADSLQTKIADGHEDGKKEGEDLLVSTMASAAGMKVATEKAAIEIASGAPNAEASENDAREAIRKTTELKTSLEQTAGIVQDQQTVNKLRNGVEDIERQLSTSQYILNAAVDQEAAAEEESESGVSVESGELSDLGESGETAAGDILGDAPAGAGTEQQYSPGQVDVNTIRKMQQERNQKEQAVKEAIRIKNEQAANEAQEGRQSF